MIFIIQIADISIFLFAKRKRIYWKRNRMQKYRKNKKVKKKVQ